jgi:hypothetical protein
MKYLFLFLLGIISTAVFSQEINKDFTKRVFSEDFSSQNETWTQTYNVDNLFVQQNGKFELVRRNMEIGYFVFPNVQDKIASFEISTALTLFTNNKVKHSSAGIVFMADKLNSSGLMVEVNQNRSYRIVRVFPDGQVPISKGKKGWVKNASAISKTYNEIVLKAHDRVYDLYINQKFVTTFTDVELTQGQFGIHIGAGSRAAFHYYNVMGEEKIQTAPNEKQENNSVEDIALTQVIVKLKNELNAKNKEIEEQKKQIRLLTANQQNAQSQTVQDTALIRKYRELNTQVSGLEMDNDILKKELLKTKAEAKRLQKFKEEVQSQQSGDIVISLSNLVAQQKEKISALEEKNKLLQQEITLCNNSQLENEKMNQQIELLKLEIQKLKDEAQNKANTPTETPKKTKSEDELNSDYIEKLLQKEKEERLKKQETKE